MLPSRTINVEILQYSYWEHFKAAKELSHVLPVDHPKRIKLQDAIEEILSELNSLNAATE